MRDTEQASSATPAATSYGTETLTDILLASLQALAAAGDVEGACRLAGRACAAVRHSDARARHRFDALLHRLCRRLSW
jgi:hypothetical protein